MDAPMASGEKGKMSEINLEGGSVIVGGMGVVDIRKSNEPQGDFVTLTIRQFAHRGVRSETTIMLTPSQARLLSEDLKAKARQMERAA